VVAPRERSLQPDHGLVQVRPERPLEARVAARAGAELGPSPGSRRRGHDAALSGEQPARDARRLPRLRPGGPRCLRRRPSLPVQLSRARPVLRVGRAHAARADGGHGDQGARVSAGGTADRAAVPALEGHDARRLPAAGERDPAARWDGGPHERRRHAALSAGQGVHVLRALHHGLLHAARFAAQPAREALDRQLLCADGADRRRLAARGEGGDADRRRLRHRDPDRGQRRL
jgi:hypothetical protein